MINLTFPLFLTLPLLQDLVRHFRTAERELSTRAGNVDTGKIATARSFLPRTPARGPKGVLVPGSAARNSLAGTGRRTSPLHRGRADTLSPVKPVLPVTIYVATDAAIPGLRTGLQRMAF